MFESISFIAIIQTPNNRQYELKIGWQMKKLLPFQMSENPSNELEQFLDFIAETNHIVDMANQWCTDTENETQDILHAIEIGNLSYQ